MWSHVNLKNVGLCGQMSPMQKKLHQQYSVNFLISEYVSRNQQIKIAIDAMKFYQHFFSTFE